jgi:hypothetical protein
MKVLAKGLQSQMDAQCANGYSLVFNGKQLLAALHSMEQAHFQQYLYW